jgi:hypothetical protein
LTAELLAIIWGVAQSLGAVISSGSEEGVLLE